METSFFPEPFLFESGDVLPGVEISYHILGALSPNRDNVIWVCHALTANSDVQTWWPGMVGDECVFDTSRFAVICANVLGSCYGTTGPLSTNPETGQPWYGKFPRVSIRDMVKAHQRLAESLGIRSIKMLVGGSLGGQQALEWAIEEPERFEHLVLLATNARHSSWGVAFNEAQRMALRTDPSFGEPLPFAGKAGLEAARAIAMMSYRSYGAFQRSQADETAEGNIFERKAITYMQHQGRKLANRFNAFSYEILLNAMDSHDVGRGRGGIEQALGRVKASTLVLSIDSDGLFPPEEQQFLALFIPDARYLSIKSLYGHDGFLIETPAIARGITHFLLNKHLTFA